MSSTYVTSSGLVVPTLAEIRSNLETSFKTTLGNDIDVSGEGPIGVIIDIMAKAVSDAYLLGQEIYSARNVNEATGTSLDNISAETGVRRIDASATTAYNVVCYGTEGTVIISGKKARQPDTSLTYSVLSDTTITKAAARDVLLAPNDTTTAITYTVTIDTVACDYIVQPGDAEGDIVDGLVSSITSADPNDFITNGGTVSNVGDELKITFEDTDFNISWNSYLDLVELGSAATFVCDETGVNSLSANSLTVIATPVTGWDSVNNPDAGITGSAAESDSALRIRRSSAIGVGSATEEAIRQRVLNDVDNVTACSVTSNRTTSTDGDGRPPKSFETVVSGGTDADVALVIWNNMPAGIVSYGTTTETITDSEGNSQDISFSRPTTTYLHVKVQRDYYSEEDYPADGDAAIKQAIVDWATTEFDLGTDVIYKRISSPVYTVSGIGDIEIFVDVTASPGDTPSYAQANIAVPSTEIVAADITRITVEDIP